MYKLIIRTASKDEELFVELSESIEDLTAAMTNYLSDTGFKEKLKNCFGIEYVWMEILNIESGQDKWNTVIKYAEFL